MNKLVENSADPEQVKAGKAAFKNARQEHLDRLRVVLATLEGQQVLWDFIEIGQYFNVLPGSASVETLNFNEGQRALAGRMALDIGEASPEALNAMLQRHFEKIQKRGTK